MQPYAIVLCLLIAACSGSRQSPPSAANSAEASDPSASASAPAAATAQPAAETGANAAAPAALTRVSSNQVCMVNNQYMGVEQIPVPVDGKTYFGCCAMCKGRLTSDPTSRVARDPLTGKAVDKALAVIVSASRDRER